MSVTIDTCYDGLGDAVTYAWIARTAEEQGRPIKVHFGNWHEVPALLDVERHATFERGDRYYKQKAGFSEHHLTELAAVHGWQTGDGPQPTRFETWCRYFNVDPTTAVRPMYAEEVVDGDEAEDAWEQVETGLDKGGFKTSGVRVALCPTCNGRERTWPTPQWVDLGEALLRRGMVPAAILPHGQTWSQLPANINTRLLCNYFATLNRADVVVCHDSAAAHIAGTLGVPTLVISGLTDPRVVFGHMMDCVRWVANAEMPCTGCHWNKEHGFRTACRSGCQSLIRLGVDTVVDAIDGIVEELS